MKRFELTVNISFLGFPLFANYTHGFTVWVNVYVLDDFVPIDERFPLLAGLR
jgi:hypothetical protein